MLGFHVGSPSDGLSPQARDMPITQKHSDEKLHHYAATIACCNKLVRQFYYRSRDLAKAKELIIK